ncbi:Bifunctional aldehyde dehydrogenase/enoyl-CoA hydratase [Sulfitobacter noctilucicola]|uniref:Oxepin-CoA hydrolase/3-oxo-5,6-dehydrosuberyl-CoA semialdehyde dehydrogenase n=1 Tax=Sulfitobacter noctilucicola TaxID=1342301 RepID=A0A7W6Q4H5_9RHOB|nr:phenylacetic acid degradation bifunctional protein PaaZ [Sulfitobacter noctilucicola]KIN62747.1 Bifunctional aldehyde dehydrogenase/enoyl-CoA hydratase [Sulfitobacter noctilucicola]MBB4172720.1 oxepin-CoA hydrolase/3-oxo-5,6-dehydrosuberyl-CoA semialdehyde dehydrogenase [Sulfitobacter noctilucicola]
MLDVQSFAAGQWIAPDSGAREIASAITGDVIAQAGTSALDVQAMLGYARDVGGPALRKLTFHDRARMLKAVAMYLMERKQVLYDLSYDTGATLSDHKIDVDGGIGTMLVFASKGRREMPDGHVFLDGPPEQLGRTGAFMGRHICTPLQGVAVHINAFNFAVWGMLEKLAPTLLAGVPAIVKPATATCYVTEACVRMMLESGLLPEGSLQLVSGGLGDMLDHLGCQDAVAFTGSADTALKLRANPVLLENSVRFASEQDSLNASVLGTDVTPDTPEFELFVKEVQREMTAKAGQKCTAIRRIMVPDALIEPVIEALKGRLSKIAVGDPRLEDTRMGALVSASQKQDVLEKASLIQAEAEIVSGNMDEFTVKGADKNKGAFVPPMLFHCADPDAAVRVHDTEAFGPVSTIMPYRDLPHAIDLLNKGKGSLVASVITNNSDVAREITLGSATFHGRLYFNNRTSMAEATGHGAPLPHMVHGGPGRAGGGEELGGIRGVMHYMQRTAVQGSPDILSAISDQWVPGASEITHKDHPFTRTFNEVGLGETFNSPSREITLEDIETFAHFTGDTFYAHMDDEAAKANPFFPGRVAHGYLLLSFAAGLFVQPDPGPVLANTGLDNLRFMAPVAAGDSIRVRLTVKHKTPRNDEYGEVRWHVTLYNQDDAVAAEYELLTMNAYG